MKREREKRVTVRQNEDELNRSEEETENEGSPMKKPSDYVPGSLLDLRILSL